MATIKETRITDMMVHVGVDEIDPTQIVVTLSATTRTNDGAAVHSYQEDITPMVTTEDAAALAPLIRKVIVRVMTDRNITAGDLAEGHASVQQLREREAREKQDLDTQVPKEVDYERVQREHFDQLTASMKEQEATAARESEQAVKAAEERAEQERKELERLLAEGLAYERRTEQAHQESKRIQRIKDEERKRQEEAEEGAKVERRAVSRPTRPTR
jgi:hydroxylamine reductase (hybrid-cluster protein)